MPRGSVEEIAGLVFCFRLHVCEFWMVVLKMTDACVLHFFNSQLAAPQESLIFIARWFLKIAVLRWLK